MPAKKPKLGQNFLVDQAACERIAGSLGEIGARTVVEIGPGKGAITSWLVRRARLLYCIELDDTLARDLQVRYSDTQNVVVRHESVLATDLASFVQPETDGGTLDVVGNLPYYITSDILLHLYAAARRGVVRRAVVMMQREVAQRIAAAPGTSDYGALSAFTQLHGSVSELFTLPPSAFAPPPDVYSTVVRIDFAPRFAELHVEPEGFNRFLRSTFAQKRKTLANNLRVAGHPAAQLAAVWPAGLSPQARAEAVPLEQMALLYRALAGSEPA